MELIGAAEVVCDSFIVYSACPEMQRLREAARALSGPAEAQPAVPGARDAYTDAARYVEGMLRYAPDEHYRALGREMGRYLRTLANDIERAEGSDPGMAPPDADDRAATHAQIQAKSRRLYTQEEYDAARFAPMGDNHHNAAACPYCSAEAGERPTQGEP